MYANHVPIINSAMRADVDVFARGVMFAVLSARTQFVTVEAQLKELDERGAKARCLFSWKRDAYLYLKKHKLQIWRDTCAATDSEDALKILCQIPGLGIVKAAFVLQFIGHDIACLDVRNIVREGRNPRAFRTDGKKIGAAFERKVARYVSETQGRAIELWDTWCGDVAETYKLTAHQVSEVHLRIVPLRLRALPVQACPHITANQIPF